MKRLLSLNIGNLIAFALMAGIVYYLLLEDNFFHMSISSIIEYSHFLKDNKHLLVLGLLPIYIASMVFGAAMVGLYLGNLLQALLSKLIKHPALFNK